MVHYWDKLKAAMKWRVDYEAYKEAVKNGTATVVVYGEDDALGRMPFHLVTRAKSLPRPILPVRHHSLR
jgi:hypothetical protein